MALGGPQRNSRILLFFFFLPVCKSGLYDGVLVPHKKKKKSKITRLKSKLREKSRNVTRIKSKHFENKVEMLRE